MVRKEVKGVSWTCDWCGDTKNVEGAEIPPNWTVVRYDTALMQQLHTWDEDDMCFKCSGRLGELKMTISHERDKPDGT